MKIAIAGSGAMSSRFGLMLARAGHEVLLIDGWAEHVAAIRKSGLIADFNGQTIVTKLAIITPEELKRGQKVELVILFPKAQQLVGTLHAVAPLFSETTKMLCLTNGLDHEQLLSQCFAPENIFLGNTMWVADLIAPGHVKLAGIGHVNLQNLVPGQEDAARDLVQLLTDAGLHGRYHDNIRQTIYLKACVNGTVNGLCTLLDCNMQQLSELGSTDAMVKNIVEEFAAIAKVEEVYFNVCDTVSQIMELCRPEHLGFHYPSMHQDLVKNGRATEIDYLNGAISRKGRKYGIPTPYCDFLTQQIHAKEDLLVK